MKQVRKLGGKIRNIVKLNKNLFLLILFILYSMNYMRCKSEEKRILPNVILIVVDTLRADHLSCYGYGRKTSPNIDNFSKDSILFKNAISPSAWTTPAVGSIFTSIYPTIIGYIDKPVILDESFLTLAETLKSNGYFTGGIISHFFIAKRLGFGQGFDYYNQENNKGHDHISSPSLTELANSFLTEKKDEKFFLFLHYFDPHYNYYMHKDFEYYSEYNGWLKSGQEISFQRGNREKLNEDDKKFLNALYDSEISFTDKYIGDVFNKLKELELYDDALIILTADHGEELGEKADHWIGHKKKLTSAIIHVPLIIKLPDNNKKLKIEEYVGTIDIMPTIVNYLNLKDPDEYYYDGEIIDLNRGKRIKNNPIFSETFNGAEDISVTWNEFKLIFKINKKDFEFYDLSNDPYENSNLKTAIYKRKKFFTYKNMLVEWWAEIVSRSDNLNLQKKYPEYSPEAVEKLKAMGYIK